MADRVSASIKLGGILPPTNADDLWCLIVAEGLSTEWDGAPFAADQIHEGGPLELFAHEVTGGSFDELENFCVSNGLPFVRWCDGYPGSWNAERVVFGGAGEPRSFMVNDSDQVVIGLAEISALGSFGAIEAHFASAELDLPPFMVAAH